MMNKESGATWKLGMFVILSIGLFIIAIYFIGKQRNLFGSTFRLQSLFKTVSGLKVGNNVRFSGINIGTVSEITLITDTSVLVDLIIKNEVRKFIKTDSRASIGSDGLMGDKVLTIAPGKASLVGVQDNDKLLSSNAVEMEDIMKSVKSSIDNAGIITSQLAQFSYKMNNGNGTLTKLITDEEFSKSLKSTLVNLQTSSKEFAVFTTKMNNGKGALSKLMSDESFGNALDSTMTNLQSGSKALSENMDAAQHNILLKGYFNKKKRAEAKKLAALKKQQALSDKNQLKKPVEGNKAKGDSTHSIIVKDTLQ